MIYVHSLGRASRYYAQRTALVVDGAAISFKALHERVQNIAAALATNGFAAGAPLAPLFPNSPEYLQVVYRRSWPAVSSSPLKTPAPATENGPRFRCVKTP